MLLLLNVPHTLHVANWWMLVPGANNHEAPPCTAALLDSLMVAANAEEEFGDARLQSLLDGVSHHPVSIELSTEPDWFERASREPGELERHFLLPNGQPTVVVRETTYAEGGLGHHIWEASIGMSIWLARHEACFEGQRVLELGSGVGLCGISAKLSGAASVVLSDFGLAEAKAEADSALLNDERSSSRLARDTLPSAQQLIDNLMHNRRANAQGGAMEVMSLDWRSCLEASFEPVERFPVVIGTDLVYDSVNAAALAATIVAHTAADGVCYLMSTMREGCSGVADLHRLLEASGSLSLAEFSVVSGFSVTPSLVLATFRPLPAAADGVHTAEFAVEGAH